MSFGLGKKIKIQFEMLPLPREMNARVACPRSRVPHRSYARKEQNKGRQEPGTQEKKEVKPAQENISS